MSRPIFGLNISDPQSRSLVRRQPAKVAVFSLASDFGCQVSITNQEEHLLDMLGMFDLVYWPMVVTASLPEAYDIAVVEGAVTTAEHQELLKKVRSVAGVVITVGSCAQTGGVLGLAEGDPFTHIRNVYGMVPDTAADAVVPRPVSSVIAVDYEVSGCPVDPEEFVATLQRALLGMQPIAERPTLCGTCRLHENACFLARGQICAGMVAVDGCDARCIQAGHPCVACRGIASSANLDSARCSISEHGLSVGRFDEVLALFNNATIELGKQEG